MDGFYAAYVTGRAGSSLLLLVIRQGVLLGVDVGGIKYDGHIRELPNDAGYFCSVVYIIPAGAALVTGAAPPIAPTRVPLEFHLPIGFGDGRVILIETPTGPLNVKFEKLRDI